MTDSAPHRRTPPPPPICNACGSANPSPNPVNAPSAQPSTTQEESARGGRGPHRGTPLAAPGGPRAARSGRPVPQRGTRPAASAAFPRGAVRALPERHGWLHENTKGQRKGFSAPSSRPFISRLRLEAGATGGAGKDGGIQTANSQWRQGSTA